MIDNTDICNRMRNKLKSFLMVCCCVAVASFALAQEPMKNPEQPTRKQQEERPAEETSDTAQKPKKDESKSPFLSKLHFGGNAWAAFGTFTYVLLQPTVAYPVNEKFLTGLSGSYIYQKEQYKTPTGSTVSFSTSLYGGSIFGRYNLYNGIFANAEYELLNYDFYNPAIGDAQRRWVGGMLVGGGYISGGSGNFRGPYLMALYNLNQTIYSPYGSPLIIRAGILF